MSCDYLIYVSPKKKNQNKNDVDEKPKVERTNPEKPRPDNNRIFPNSFGSETPKNKAKTIAKTHQKTQKPTQPPKNKSSLPKIFPQSDPKKKGTTKKTAKDTGPDTEKTK